MPLVKRTGAILVALLLTLTLVAPSTAHADATTDKSITNASKWISDTWNDPTGRKLFFAAGTTADGVIALSAANQYPNTVRSMLLDLKARGPAYSVNDPAGLAKMIMTADIAGQNPRTFFGCQRDLVAELQAMVAGGPTTSREFWGPYLIAIALARAGEQVPDWVIAHMESNQKSGGFGYTDNKGAFVADPDYTAIGLSAMDRVSKNPKNAKDQKRANTSVANATAWSANAAHQKHDASSNSNYWETYSSANSTGMLASALGEVGVDISSPTRYLVSQQKVDGGWAASHNGKKSDVMATTQAILGVIGDGYGTARSTQVPDLAQCGTNTPPVTTPAKTVYNTAGAHFVNGREWFTTCEKYSQTTRCRTTIKATTVTQVNGTFVAKTEYVFNNLTYLPSSRTLWKGNPLGGNGQVGARVSWTARDGRTWRTECDTSTTGRNGCRSYTTARVIDNVAKAGQPIRYAWVTKEIFNNMVQFS